MHNPIIDERLSLILESIDLILERTESITKPSEFVANKDAILLMDSIAMRLQVVGENVKKVESIEPDFFLIN